MEVSDVEVFSADPCMYVFMNTKWWDLFWKQTNKQQTQKKPSKTHCDLSSILEADPMVLKRAATAILCSATKRWTSPSHPQGFADVLSLQGLDSIVWKRAEFAHMLIVICPTAGFF